MKIKNLDHLVITTADLAACINFYAKILGLGHEEKNGRHAFRFGSSKLNVHRYAGEFLPAAKAPTAGSLDFCLIIEGDIEAARREIEERGGTIEEGIVERNGALGKMRSIYLRDPDGNLVELASYE